ncbi:MAG: pilin [Chromatiales bacterium]|nr:pilin [Chromatiales bacterium]
MKLAAQTGFVFIELVVVLIIIGLLAAVALPTYRDYALSAAVVEGLLLAQPLRDKVEEYYAYHGRFPRDNRALAINEPGALFSDAIERIEVRDGAIHLHYRQNDSSDLPDGVLSLRPTLSVKQADAPIVWVCAQRSAASRRAAGEDLSDLEAPYLRRACQEWGAENK